MPLTEQEVSRLEEILSTLADAKVKMDARSREFFDDQELRYNKYGADMRLSPKQWQWLENLMERHG